MNDANAEAWEIYGYARLDAMGITVSGLLSLCEMVGPQDPSECLFKIRELISEHAKIKAKRDREREQMDRIARPESDEGPTF